MSMSRKSEAPDYRMRVVAELRQIEAPLWNRMAGTGPGAVFVRHEWLAALESSGCVGGNTGWQPLHLLLEDGAGNLQGAVPLYAKSHSYGEYVFDWAWADAYQRNGLEYYPKLLSAVPFTPIAGTRLLVQPGADGAEVRAALPVSRSARPPGPGGRRLHDSPWRAIPLAEPGFCRFRRISGRDEPAQTQKDSCRAPQSDRGRRQL